MHKALTEANYSVQKKPPLGRGGRLLNQNPTVQKISEPATDKGGVYMFIIFQTFASSHPADSVSDQYSNH